MNQKVNYTQVIWEITSLLQESESLEDALRVSLGMVVKAVDAEAGTIWFYNKNGDGRIYPSFWIGGADLTGMSLATGEGIASLHLTARMGQMASGTERKTRPEPVRTAELAAKAGAPVKPTDPARIWTLPKVPL